MIINEASDPMKCTNCQEVVKLDLQAMAADVDKDPSIWAWACPSCKTRIVQKLTSKDPFTAETLVIKSKVRA